jgi:hypothetical protein
LDFDSAWLTDDLNSMQLQVQALQTNFINAKAPNFESQTTSTDSMSRLEFFDDLMWGTTSLPDTTIYNLNTTVYDSVGYRMNSLETILSNESMQGTSLFSKAG